MAALVVATSSSSSSSSSSPSSPSSLSAVVAAAAAAASAPANDVAALARPHAIDDDNDDEYCYEYDDEYDDEYDAFTERDRDRDPFVVASPPSVAAVCRDGVAMVSLHYDVDLPEGEGAEEEEEEADDDDVGDGGGDDEAVEMSSATDSGGKGGGRAVASSLTLTTTTADVASRTDDGSGISSFSSSSSPNHFRDLPSSSRGPLRIESVHDNYHHRRGAPPMSLLTAGWRTDGMALADAARALAADEVRLFCPPSSMSSSSSSSVAMGRRIARGLSYYLAKCASSGAGGGGGVRSLSCVGLLACAGGGGKKKGGGGGTLHLIDATGAYRVRAHAVGSGSDALHRRMAYVDFGSMDCEEGLRALLRLVAEADGGDEGRGGRGGDGRRGCDDDDGGSVAVVVALGDEEGSERRRRLSQPRARRPVPSDPPNEGWNLPPSGPRRRVVVVELAVLRTGEGGMRRVRLSSLFPPPLPLLAGGGARPSG